MRCALAALLVIAIAAPAIADDRVDLTTTWYQERRRGGVGGLTVIHPQLDFQIEGDLFDFGVGYAADAVTGATATVYTVDAVSGATKFDDLRHQGSITFGMHGRRARLAASGSVAVERDYLSIAFGGGGSIDLPGKNTTIALGYTHNMDSVCDLANAELTPLERRPLTGGDPCAKNVIFGEDSFNSMTQEPITVWRDLKIDTAQATVTQNLSPTMNLQASVFGSVLQGFQSNPYRRVRVGPNEPQEHIPAVRARLALSARVNRFLPLLKSAAHLDGRFYSDTWGVNAGSIELGYSQYLGDNLLLRVHGRVHQQSAATFFKDAFFYETESSAGEYFTGDRELAPVRNIILGGKLSLLSIAEDENKVLGLFEKLQVNVRGDLLLMDELAAQDEALNQLGRGNQFLTSGQFLDAILLQVGVLADY